MNKGLPLEARAAVLVVDDELVRILTVQALEEAGFRVEEAGNSDEALSRELVCGLASLEGSVPIIKDYPVYDFKVEARVHFFTENVRYWHKTDVSLLSVKRPLIGAKRT